MRRAGRIATGAVLASVTMLGVQLWGPGYRVDQVDRVVPVVPTTPATPSDDSTLALDPPKPTPGDPTGTPGPTRSSTRPADGGTGKGKKAAPTTAAGRPAPTRTTAARGPGITPLIRDGAPVPSNGPAGPPAVVAAVETDLFPGQSGDEADDSAIWRNPSRPERSLVVADNKADSGGVAVYNLRGDFVHYARVGKIGNIDLRSGVRLGGRSVILVGANDRSTSTIRFWTLDPARGTLASVDARSLATVTPNYGFCLGRSANGAQTYAFVSGETSGTFEQYLLRLSTGRVDAVKVRTLNVGSLSEACVVDDTRGAVYIAEEDVGVWRYALDPATGAARTSIDTVASGRLAADVEGLGIARGADGRGVLVASSQGNSTYSVYDADGRHAYRGSFRVGSSGAVDGVTHTDGLAIASGGFGSTYPDGLLVVHDGENESGAGSNLKFARFDQVFKLGS